jgi:hypothetical protein
LKQLFVLALAPLFLTSCTNFQQYVYNCTNLPVTIRNYHVEPSSYFGWRTNLSPLTIADFAGFPDGSSRDPTRIKEHDLHSASSGMSRTDPSSVCTQFKSQIVIVDLE